MRPYEIDIEPIIHEALNNLLLDQERQYGLFKGLFGSFKIQVSEDIEFDPNKIRQILEQGFLYLIDDISGVIPSLPACSQGHPFVYQGDDTLLMYVEINTSFYQITDSIRARLVPEVAVRYLQYSHP